MGLIKRTVGIVVALGWASAVVVYAQPTGGPYKDIKEIPDSAIGRRVSELLDVVNSGNPDRAREYVTSTFAPAFRDAFPMAKHVGVFGNFHERSRGFEFAGLRQYDPPRPDTEVVIVVRNKLTESWQAFVVEVESTAPHRIASLSLNPARPPSYLSKPEGTLTDEQVVTELGRLVDRVCDGDAFSGAVLLAKNGRPIFQKACGSAGKSFNAPNKLDTKFNLGSMNKMLTAVAVAQLVERGKLSFDDPIGKYLSEDWLAREYSQKITVGQLLSHTSGLGSYFNEKFMNASRELYRTVDDYKPMVAVDKPKFEPGTDWSYSNTGFLLAGAVIEKITGQNYFDFIRENIYKPAGMTNSDSYDMDEPVPNLAIGYWREPGEDGKTRWKSNVLKHVVRGGPAGGGFSTVEDLLKFDAALRSEKLLTAKITEVLWTPKPGSAEYGYGFGLDGETGRRRVGHSGGFPGISAFFEMYLDDGYTVVVLSNYSDAATLVAEKLSELLARTK